MIIIMQLSPEDTSLSKLKNLHAFSAVNIQNCLHVLFCRTVKIMAGHILSINIDSTCFFMLCGITAHICVWHKAR